MARIRTIKPDFFIDDKIGDLTVMARLLFVGLWCLADKAGRLEDNPKKIKVQILPYDNANTDLLLSEIGEKGLIVRYEVDGKNYIQISNFLKHQRPHHTEKDSDFPEFNGELTVISRLLDGEVPDGMEWNGIEKGMENGMEGSPEGKSPPAPITKKPRSLKTSGKSVKTPPRVPATPPQSDEDWLQSLKEVEAYRGLDLDAEVSKIKAWLVLRPNRKMTRRFVLNWLNRAEKPMEVRSGKSVIEQWLAESDDQGSVFGPHHASKKPLPCDRIEQGEACDDVRLLEGPSGGKTDEGV